MSRIRHCDGPPRLGQGVYCGLPTRNPSGLCTYHRTRPAPEPEPDDRLDTADSVDVPAPRQPSENAP